MPVLQIQSPALHLPPLLFLPRATPLSTSSARSLPQSRATTALPLSLSLSSARRGGPPAALPVNDRDLLEALEELSSSNEGEAAELLPAIRSYETDLARLTLVGEVGLDQALTAAAIDGGDSAEKQLSAGTSAMVVQAVSPSGADERSTVSTRLFLPAEKVKEKAKILRSSLTADILLANDASKKDLLAMTFQQVVMQQLWVFELSMFPPGIERDMKDLANPREAQVLREFMVSSSDEKFLSTLAEVLCSCALKSTEKNYAHNVGGLTSNGMFHWFRKPQRTMSLDSSIGISSVPEEVVVKKARSHVEKFNMVKGKLASRERKLKHCWWASPTYSRLDRCGGPEFSDWANEFVPAYRLQIDAAKFKDIKLEGWKNLSENRWEVLLTHFQMVELANILDMFYEDRYTIPDKQLSCGLVTENLIISQNKNSSWKMLFVYVIGGSIFLFITIVAQLCWPHLLRTRKTSEHYSPASSEIDYLQLQPLEASDLDVMCISIIKQIKDALGWPGEVMMDASVGAWTGMLPSYLRSCDLHAISCIEEPATTSSNREIQTYADSSAAAASPLETNTTDMQTSGQDIASYQVVLSGDGKIIGFQPTSRMAVNHWASNPLAKVLYKGRKLSPGLLEPSIKIPLPNKTILIELLMSVNPGSWFALARPIK